MNYELISSCFLNFILTLFVYLSFPFYLKYIKKNYNIESVKKIVIINSIIGWFIFTFLNILLNEPKVANPAPTLLYGAISYTILNKKKKNINNNYDLIKSENISNNKKIVDTSKNQKAKKNKDLLYNSAIIILLIILIIVIIILSFIFLNSHYQTIINNHEITIKNLQSTNSLLNKKLDAYRSEFDRFEQYLIEKDIK